MHFKANHHLFAFVIILAAEDLGINLFLTQLPGDCLATQGSCAKQRQWTANVFLHISPSGDLYHVYKVTIKSDALWQSVVVMLYIKKIN